MFTGHARHSYTLKLTSPSTSSFQTQFREHTFHFERFFKSISVRSVFDQWMEMGRRQTGSDVTEPLEFLLLDVVVTDALSADDTLHEREAENITFA